MQRQRSAHTAACGSQALWNEQLHMTLVIAPELINKSVAPMAPVRPLSHKVLRQHSTRSAQAAKLPGTRAARQVLGL